MSDFDRPRRLSLVDIGGMLYTRKEHPLDEVITVQWDPEMGEVRTLTARLPSPARLSRQMGGFSLRSS
jgi:hypothetical protein